MLPLFHIITPKLPPQTMLTNTNNEVPVKPRRQKIEVPVHKIQQEESDIIVETKKKRYPTDLQSKRSLWKNNYSENVKQAGDFVPPESERSTKASRKHLHKENLKLTKENKELILKFNELEELSVRKITKLKEKISSVQNFNAEVLKENETIKEQYQNLFINYEDIRNQLELNQYCKNCEDLKKNVEKCSEDNNKLRTSNKELTEDLNMLKTVIFRLNVQLERYQENLRKNNITINKIPQIIHNNQATENIPPTINNILSETHQDHSHTPISWGNVNIHTLGPLLDAYQDTVTEKEEIIQNYETEISNFTGKLKEIIKENEVLHHKLTADDECSARLKLQLVDLKQELKVTKEQNDVLIKKCAMKQDKIEEILKCYENKVDQLKRDYTVAHEQYFKCRSEVAALREKNKSLIDAQDDFRNERQNYIPVSVHNASVNECKKWYEQLKLQYENEKTKLKESIDVQSKMINDLNIKMASLNATKQELEAKIAHLDKHIKKSESKYLELEHTLNEVQLSRSACRKQLHKVMNFAKDMVSEQETLLKALNQRHLENKAVKRIGSDMATKMDSLKSQLKDVQKNAWQEFSTVEQRIQEQEELIENMKDEHNQEIDRLKTIIKQQEETNILLKNDNLPLPHYLLFKEKYK